MSKILISFFFFFFVFFQKEEGMENVSMYTIVSILLSKMANVVYGFQ